MNFIGEEFANLFGVFFVFFGFLVIEIGVTVYVVVPPRFRLPFIFFGGKLYVEFGIEALFRLGDEGLPRQLIIRPTAKRTYSVGCGCGRGRFKGKRQFCGLRVL